MITQKLFVLQIISSAGMRYTDLKCPCFDFDPEVIRKCSKIVTLFHLIFKVVTKIGETQMKRKRNANETQMNTNKNKRKKEEKKRIYIYPFLFLKFFIFLFFLKLLNNHKITLLNRFLQAFKNNVFYRQKQALFRFYPPFLYKYTLKNKSPLKLIYDGFINIRFFYSVRNVK